MAKHCKECGRQFTPRQYNGGFCCTGCRRSFNNRRATRGAMLYDLIMIEAYDTDLAERMGIVGRYKELAAMFRAEDLTEGRPRTWKRASDTARDVDEYLG